MKGDVIQFEWSGTPEEPDTNGPLYDHAAIVVDIVGGEPYLAAHTTDHESEPLTNFMPWEKIRFIHIERSNGYPPVKAQITQGIDDVGLNPLSSCSYASWWPELYFGIDPNYPSCNYVSSGFRFNNVQIPQGAQMKYAYLTFSVDGPFTDPLDVKIYGENAANSEIFASPPQNRSLTSPISWPITNAWYVGDRRTTPNLSTIVQSIVGITGNPGPGWQYGNSLSFIFKDPGPATTSVRRVISFERAGWDHAYGLPYSPPK